MTSEDKTEWPVLVKRAGYSSLRDFASKIGIAHTTVSKTFHGQTRPSDETARAIAQALNMSTVEFWERMGERPTTPFELPSKARHLSFSQRQAVLAVVNGMLEGREDLAADEDAGSHAATSNESESGAKAAGRLGRKLQGDVFSEDRKRG